MNFKQTYTKRISLLLIISTLTINFSFLTTPHKVSAVEVLGTGVDMTEVWFAANGAQLTAWLNVAQPAQTAAQTTTSLKAIASGIWDTIGKYIREGFLAGVAKQLALNLIKQITQATVDWINGGMNKPPSYVSDLNKFLLGPGGVGDRAIGDFFANEPGLRFLCEPFKVQVQLALQLPYGSTLTDKLGCTYTAISQNVQGAIDSSGFSIDVNGNRININRSNFKDKGGWNSWLVQTLQPQNNPIGAYYTAKSALEEKIAQKTNNVATELGFGQGALTFKMCVDVYYDINNKYIRQSDEYMDNSGVPGDWPANLSMKKGKIEQKCQVKTPGATITGMLREKANSAQEMTEIQAALANGIDTIIGSLLTALINAAKESIVKGILDDGKNSPAAKSYEKSLADALSNITNTYNNQLTGGYYVPGLYATSSEYTDPLIWTYNPGTGEPFTFNSLTWKYDPATGLLFNFGSTTPGYDPTTWKFDPVTGEQTVWKYDPITGVLLPSDSTTQLGYTGTGGFSTLDLAKRNATLLINSFLSAESVYKNNYLIAKNTLMEGQRVFASSSVCNMNYNRNETVLRSLLIRANVTTNIDGAYDSNRTIASVPWNYKTIEKSLEKTGANTTVLNKALSDVSAASKISSVTDAMIPVNSTSFDIDSESKMVGNIKTWLRGLQNMYSTPLCPIDLTKVLQITTIAGQ